MYLYPVKDVITENACDGFLRQFASLNINYYLEKYACDRTVAGVKHASF